MAFKDDVTSGVTDVLGVSWSTTNGQVVPKTEDVTLKNGAVKLDATYVYADLADSSHLAQKVKNEVAGKIIRAYVSAATRILLHQDGAIRSFDGDRVMAIFVGKNKNTSAVRAALNINWAYDKVIWPKVKDKWKDITDHYYMSHGVGIASGEALIIRGGVRGSNDLISIGEAPNLAAKLSDMRTGRQLHIASGVYFAMNDSVKYTDVSKTNMWHQEKARDITVGGKYYTVYHSGYLQAP